MSSTVTIRRLARHEVHDHVEAMAEVLIDCVEGGASVSFMKPLSRERAQAFWRKVADEAARGERVVLVAVDEDVGRIVGTVQLILGLPENQPHRADVAKMLVHRSARRRGIAEQLMRALEQTALEEGRDLLVLDTVTGGDAERLYARLGWQRVGEVPRYALMPDGGFCSTTFFFKSLNPSAKS